MFNTTQRLTKIAIIGTGRVGASCAYALQLRGLVSEIVLINANRQGIARTLELPLSDEEEAGLARSAGIIQSAIESLDLDEQIRIGKIPSVRLFLEQKELA